MPSYNARDLRAFKEGLPDLIEEILTELGVEEVEGGDTRIVAHPDDVKEYLAAAIYEEIVERLSGDEDGEEEG